MKRKHPFVLGKIYHVYNDGVAKCPICNGEVDFWRMTQGFCLFNDIKSTNQILWRLEREQKRLTMNVLKKYVSSTNGQRKPLVHILAYCIMGNHFHLLLEEIQEGGISKFMQKLCSGYAGYFNKKYDRVGSLFRNRFKSILVDNEKYLLYLLVYINVLNPAELVMPKWKEKGISDIEKALVSAEEYQFSSHLDYLGKRGSLIIDKGIFRELVPTPQAYLDLVKAVLEEKKYREIEHLTLE